MSDATPVTPLKYRAFISYSHADKAWGDWLHKALESYAVPAKLVGMPTASAGPVPKRLYPIFRDREELPTSADLGGQITAALNASQFLVVIASPRSAKSRWVNEEVLAFKRLGREAQILPIIIDGEPNAADKPGYDPDTDCFCPALKFAIGPDGELTDHPFEPICADARLQGDGKPNALLKLVAGLLNVGFDALKQRDAEAQRRRRRIRTAIAATAALTLVGGVTGLVFQQRSAAADRSAALAELARTASDGHRHEQAMRFALLGTLGHDHPILGFDAADAFAELRRAAAAWRGAFAAAGTPDEPLTSAALSPDGTRIALGDKKGTVRFLDTATGVEVARYAGTAAEIYRFAYAPGGGAIATVAGTRYYDGIMGLKLGGGYEHAPDFTPEIAVVDPASGKIVSRIAGHAAEIAWIGFTPDGGRVLTASSGTTLLSDAATGRELMRYVDGGASCGPGVAGADPIIAALSPAGDRLLLPCSDTQFRIFEVATGAVLGRCALGDTLATRVVSAAYAPDGTRLMLVFEQQNFVIADPATCAVLGADQAMPPIWAAAWSPTGEAVVLARRDGGLQVYDLMQGGIVTTAGGDTQPVVSLAFAAGDSRIVAAHLDGTVRVWNYGGSTIGGLGDTELQAVYRSGRTGLQELTLSADRTRALTLIGGEARLWRIDPPPGGPVFEAGSADTLAVSPDNTRLALADMFDGPARIVDARTGDPVATLEGKPINLWPGAFSPDGKTLTGGGMDQPAALWDASTGKLIRTLDAGGAEPAYGASFSANGRFIAVATTKGPVRILSAAGDSEVARFDPTQYWKELPNQAVVSPDGARLAANTLATGSFLLVDLATGQPIVNTKGSEGAMLEAAPGTFVRSFAMSPDGDEIALGVDGSIRIIAAADGAVRSEVNYGSHGFSSLRYSADGRLLIGAHFSEVVVIDTASRRELWRTTFRPRDDWMNLVAVPFTGGGAFAALGSATSNNALRIVSLEPALIAERSTLVSGLCAGPLARGQSRFSDADLAAAPFVDAKLDRDPCDPPSWTTRMAAALGM